MNTFFDRRSTLIRKGMAFGGRASARQMLAAAFYLGLILATTPMMASSDQSVQDVTVQERDGLYRVEARFAVPHSGALAFAVLTDYEHIPRFMPDVRTSTVLERAEGRAVVEQEAIARVMMFSKRVHLMLEVQEENATIRFRDRSGKSFTRYEGSWQITEHREGAAIAYHLVAKPSFDVPEFLLRRLLKRDARVMIQRLQAEIAARSGVRSTPISQVIAVPSVNVTHPTCLSAGQPAEPNARAEW